jgi:serine protease Do
MKQIKTLKKSLLALVMVGILLATGFQTGTAAVDPGVRMIPENFSQLAKEVRPGVVNIRTEKTMKDSGPVSRHFFGNPFGNPDPHGNIPGPFFQPNPNRKFKQQSLGSGFVIDRRGYIVTNHHVIENADKIRVKLSNGQEFDAKVIGGDPNTDLALIKIKASDELVPIKTGDSDSIAVGSWVVAIGSPFGLEQTVTAGIVSAKGRVIGAGPYDDFIQTDASINPGNSGGPLLNMQGEVVGINTAIIAQGQGIGFAIPINLAQGIVKQLKENGEVTRGWLGVSIQNLTPELKAYYNAKDRKGVLVTEAYEGDPADNAGIKARDIITGVNGKRISTARDLSKTIAASPVGKEISISVIRDGKEKTIQVTLAKRGESKLYAKQHQDKENELGLELSGLNSEMARRLGIPKDEKGVLVTRVAPDGKGDRAGIQKGDVVKEVNRISVSTLEDYYRNIEKADSSKPIQFLIKRPNVGYLAIKIV